MKTAFVTKNKEIMGGAPVIKGTRIPVERLQFLIEQGYTEKNLQKEFPGLGVKKIRGALAELIGVGISQLES